MKTFFCNLALVLTTVVVTLALTVLTQHMELYWDGQPVWTKPAVNREVRNIRNESPVSPCSSPAVANTAWEYYNDAPPAVDLADMAETMQGAALVMARLKGFETPAAKARGIVWRTKLLDGSRCYRRTPGVLVVDIESRRMGLVFRDQTGGNLQFLERLPTPNE